MAGIDLERLGWTAVEQAAHVDPSLVPGRVIVEHRDRVEVMTAEGVWTCELAGRVRARKKAKHSLEKPAVGDFVLVRRGTPPIVEHLIPRRSALIRRAAGTSPKPQIVATNVDVVFVVTALGGDLNVRRLERYSAVIAECALPAVVVLNKVDLGPVTSELEQIRTAWPQAGLVAASGVTGYGIEELRAHLGPGRTGALIGSSGVGKSTLVNALVGRSVHATAEIRASDARGRHTTTFRALVPLGDDASGGLLIDSPGMRELASWEESTADAFDDLEALAADCRFSDCGHRTEPGCAVRGAAGVDPVRLEAYLALRAEQRESKSARRR